MQNVFQGTYWSITILRCYGEILPPDILELDLVRLKQTGMLAKLRSHPSNGLALAPLCVTRFKGSLIMTHMMILVQNHAYLAKRVHIYKNWFPAVCVSLAVQTWTPYVHTISMKKKYIPFYTDNNRCYLVYQIWNNH